MRFLGTHNDLGKCSFLMLSCKSRIQNCTLSKGAEDSETVVPNVTLFHHNQLVSLPILSQLSVGPTGLWVQVRSWALCALAEKPGVKLPSLGAGQAPGNQYLREFPARIIK